MKEMRLRLILHQRTEVLWTPNFVFYLNNRVCKGLWALCRVLGRSPILLVPGGVWLQG